MIIRKMELTDIDEVYAIEKENFSMPWTKEDFKNAIIGSSYYINIYLAAVENGEIIGYCGLWGIAGEGQINNVSVREKYRKLGVGERMLSELILLGREENLDSFTLEVRAGNTPAIRLYQKLGFTEAGVRKNFYDKPREDAIIMWHHL